MFAAYLESNFGKNLEVLRVKIHDYLGMVLNYSKKKYSKMSMIKSIRKILKDFPEVIN